MMKCIRVVLVAVLLIQAISLPCAAQKDMILKADEINYAFLPGKRIRITAPSHVAYRFVGTLAKLDADSLMLKSEDGRQLMVSLNSISRFEVSIGQKSRAKIGAVIGLLTSATAGFLFIDFTNTRTTPGWFGLGGTETRPRKEGFEQLLFLCSAGTAMGILIGTKIKNERWKQVALPVRLGIVPQRQGGLTLSASFAF